MIASEMTSFLFSVWLNMDKKMESKNTDSVPDGLRELVAKIAVKDASAISRLYTEIADTLMGVIYSVLKNRADAEETLQEVFLIIWEKAASYQPALGKPQSWLITIARNKALDRCRANARSFQGKLEYADQLAEGSAEAPRKLGAEELSHALKQLTMEQREAIELVFLKGMTQQEAALSLNCPLGTLKARVRRGLQSLKQTLTRIPHHG